jgi:hypothetical protein
MSFEADFAMPQPVHYSQPIHFEFEPTSLLQRPQLAARIAMISAAWNDVEARIAAFLAALSGNEAQTVISIFLALRIDSAKRSTIDTISVLKLSTTDHERFQEILKDLNKRYGERNTMVHGNWGVSEKYPNKLLWADIRDTTIMSANMMKLVGDQHAKERRAMLIEVQKKFMVYGEADFIKISDRMIAAYDELRDFTRPFMERAFGPSTIID